MISFSLPSHLNTRFTQLLIAAAFLTGLSWLVLGSSYSGPIQEHVPFLHGAKAPDRPRHPIDTLVQKAEREHDRLLAKETHTLHDAAEAYQLRRGRRPPPGFDHWFRFAQDHGALIVEDFFDQIYYDLAPFWAIPPLRMRQQANDFIHRISVRNGSTSQRTDIESRPWLDLWEDLVGTVAEFLPDLDMAINEMDESRIIVPWETVDGYMETERESRVIVPEEEVKTEFTRTVVGVEEEVPKFDPQFHAAGPYWDLAVVGCHPSSAARVNYTPEVDFTKPPPLPTTRPLRSYKGYVSNWTLTKSPCDNPTLQALHGTFVEPISISSSAQLFPMFGGSKLPMNNEILLPPAMYWTKDPFYSGGDAHGGSWEQKTTKIIWRGGASGGRNRAENWTRFQRHRFLAMVNGTSVTAAEHGNEPPPNMELPRYGTYDLMAARDEALGEWMAAIADAGFVHLQCFPDPDPPRCAYTDPWFEVKKSMPMSEQYGYKYLPDIDGNSFSGRYRGFLGSTSLPLKATIYDEWHDSRLVPWRHFVPMDNTFVDVYGVMDYFVGYEGVGGHDDVARRIALGGKEWAERVLRREDMQIYVFRLLLEYARVCDDERERLGWVEREAVV